MSNTEDSSKIYKSAEELQVIWPDVWKFVLAKHTEAVGSNNEDLLAETLNDAVRRFSGTGQNDNSPANSSDVHVGDRMMDFCQSEYERKVSERLKDKAIQDSMWGYLKLLWNKLVESFKKNPVKTVGATCAMLAMGTASTTAGNAVAKNYIVPHIISYVSSQPGTVDVNTVELKHVSPIAPCSTLEYETKCTVYPTLTGTLESLNVKNNGIVRKGEIIAQVDSSDLSDSLKKARADLKLAEDRLHAALYNPGAEVAIKQAELAEAEHRRDEARAKSMRYNKLLLECIISDQEAHETDSDYAACQARCDRAKAAVDNAKDEVNEKLAVLKASVEQANSVVETLKSQCDSKFGLYIIRAPMAGRVSKLFISDGGTVTPNVPVVEIVRDDTMYAKFYVNEKNWNLINDNKKQVCYNNHTGCVGKCNNAALTSNLARDGSRIFEVHASISKELSSRLDLKPGATLDIDVISNVEARNNKLLRIPYDAVLTPESEVSEVYVICKGKAIKKSVLLKPSVNSADYREVTEGLKSGDHVVINPWTAGLKDGDIVRENQQAMEF